MDRPEAWSKGDYPAIEDLMPHRDSVVLIDRILRHSAESTDVLVSVEKQRWMKNADGTVGGSLAVEYMAQCVAAREGLIALEEGRPPPTGFLVGISRLRLEVSNFAANAELRVRSWRVRGRPSLGALSHRCELYLGQHEPGELIGEGRLSVSVPREPEI